MNQVSLGASMRTNLLSLQQTSGLQDKTQVRLASGLKVNSAIENPSSYYIAKSLNNRSSDLSVLLDSIGQGIQTIKTADEALQSAVAFLAQASVAAEQAVANAVLEVVEDTELKPSKKISDFVAEGYSVITSDMNSAAIQALISENAKLVLADDVVLDAGLDINADNVTIDGNGHKLSYGGKAANDNMLDVSGGNAKINNIEFEYINGLGGSVISVDGAGASAEVSSIKMEASGKRVYGLRATNKASVTLDNALGIKVTGAGSQKLVNGNAELFDGKGNTAAIVGQIGKDGLAAYAATQFYVGDKTGDFGQGNWYLPSIGELMEVYGYNADAMTSGDGTSGATGTNKNVINSALTTLAGKGVESAALTNGYYWSSSECNNYASWLLDMSSGYRSFNLKSYSNIVRCFQLVENCFNPFNSSADALSGSSAVAPKIGDIMYSDKSYGSADDYDGSKTAVGVVTSVSADGTSATIMNLKDLRFSSYTSVDNFNPDAPYTGSYGSTYHTTSAKYSTDITEISNYTYTPLLAGMKTGATINVTNTVSDSVPVINSGNALVDADYATQFNAILEQYDSLIQDASYKGINLLKSQNLSIIFNETRSSKLDIVGVDASTSGLGLNKAEWKITDDVNDSIQELTAAINAIRAQMSYFGTSFEIVSNREDFTKNLINILNEGADKLVLADMNEESANMLALQTRQQLAVNSLSLVSQAAQSILNLF